MATAVARRPGATFGRSIAGVRVPEAAGVAVLVVLSFVLRTDAIGVHYWIDEGLSVGIASHSLTAIPGVLRLDGSPPLYYMLLHVWMSVFGSSETATHWLSVLFALATVPASWWAGRSLFGRATGWALAVLASLEPFLTQYAQETRMYSLIVLLGTLATACFLHAFVFDRPRYRVPFGLLLAAMLYTHNWTIFYIGALAIGLVAIWLSSDHRRRLAKDVAVGFGLPALLYLPWLPTMIFQARHTGAPWATRPSFDALIHAPDLLLGSQAGTYAVLLAGGAGLAQLYRGSRHERRVLVPTLASMALGPIVLAWLMSQVSPAWATRYLAVAVAPLLLLCSVGLARAGRLGAVGFVLLVLLFAGYSPPLVKSNAHYLAQSLGSQTRPGDLVVVTQPEQVPVLSYYLPPGLRYANPFGAVRDPAVTDWRDGFEHFAHTSSERQLLPLLRGVHAGQHVLLVVPITTDRGHWSAPWTWWVRERSLEYEGLLRGDPRLRLVDSMPQEVGPPGPNPLQGLLFVKTREG